jgi:hypothetical protein
MQLKSAWMAKDRENDDDDKAVEEDVLMEGTA